MRNVKLIAPKRVPPGDPTALVEVFYQIAKEYAELQKVKEQEKSKRYEIKKRIKTIQKTIKLYLEEYRRIVNTRFNEREEIINHFLSAFKNACDKNDYKLVEILGYHLVEIVSKPVITEEDIKGLMPVISSLYYLDSKKNEISEDEDIIPAEIEL